MATTTKITTKWATICIVGYSGSVASGAAENRMSHGAVCLCQARRGAKGLLGRKVNSNGWHSETGKSFSLDAETLARWERIGAGR